MRGIATFLVLGTLLASPAAAENENTTLVLHVVPRGEFGCSVTGVCDGTAPNVEVRGGEEYVVAVLARNFDAGLEGAVCAFDWHWSWTLSYSFWDCLPGSINELYPQGAGPRDGFVGVLFDCLEPGTTAVIGWLVMEVGETGCLEVIAPEVGVRAINCNPTDTFIDLRNVGRVCVGEGGYAPCDPVTVPVEATSWGRIKRQFVPARVEEPRAGR